MAVAATVAVVVTVAVSVGEAVLLHVATGMLDWGGDVGVTGVSGVTVDADSGTGDTDTATGRGNLRATDADAAAGPAVVIGGETISAVAAAVGAATKALDERGAAGIGTTVMGTAADDDDDTDDDDTDEDDATDAADSAGDTALPAAYRCLAA